MGAQLVDRIVLEQLIGRRRLHRARRRRLHLAEQNVMVRDERRLLQVARLRVRNLGIAILERHPQRRLGNAVEIQVVLADELVHARIGAAPPVAHRAQLFAASLERRGREAHGSPQAFGPAPHRKVVNAFHLGHLHAPLHIAGNAERHERLARTEANSGGGELVAGGVARFDVGELEFKALFVAFGGMELMRRQFRLDSAIVGLELVFDIDDGRHEEFLGRLRHHGTHLGVGLEVFGNLAKLFAEIRQVEIPIAHGTKLRHATRERRRGLDKVGGIELVAQVAFVGIGLFRLTALHGAIAMHLAAVEELARLRVVELQRFHKAQVAVFMQLFKQVVRHALMHFARATNARTLVNGKRDVVSIERRLLCIVVALHIVDDGALEALVFAGLAVALLDRRAEAVGARNEEHILFANAVAKKARIGVGGHEHARNVAEVQLLIAIGHARGNNRTRRPSQFAGIAHERTPSFFNSSINFAAAAEVAESLSLSESKSISELKSLDWVSVITL